MFSLNYKVSLLMVSLVVSVLPNIAHAKTALTENQKVSYALGYMLAKDYRGSVDYLDLEVFNQGFNSSYLKEKPLISDSEMTQVIQEYSEKRQAQMLEEMKAYGEVNLIEAEVFLAENKDKKGITTTESGLQYRVITEGKGRTPTKTDTVKVHYEGTLLDGTVFDSSYVRGNAIEFPLERVIDGWVEGLQLMNKGAKYQFFIHPNLAYGEVGTVGIEPNSLLIFTVELINFMSSK